MELIKESHSFTHPAPRLDLIERIALLSLGTGLALLALSAFDFYQEDVTSPTLALTLCLITVGGIVFSIRTHLKKHAGIQNNGITRSATTARGWVGWLFAVFFTAFYCILYWAPDKMIGLIHFFTPLSELLRNQPADKWFVYGSFYSFSVLILGVKAIVKYRHNRYQIIRTCSIIFFQLVFSYLLPAWMQALNQPSFYPTYFWPLSYNNLFPSSVQGLLDQQTGVAMFILGWGMVMTFIATPVITYFVGKRWYCSWVCGCGGLAETVGDEWRQLSDKSVKAWKFEKISIYSILIFIVVLTGMLWIHAETGALPEISQNLKKFYGFFVGSVLSGVVGVGLYPLMGTRVWCRFACPMAAILGMIQRVKSRFRITTNGAQCISCGNCSKYCEMGIDVRWYAQRGQDIVRASCVGCGICSAVCPRGVLNLENGPSSERQLFPITQYGTMSTPMIKSSEEILKNGNKKKPSNS